MFGCAVRCVRSSGDAVRLQCGLSPSYVFTIVLNALYPLARPLLFSMDPEDAHHFTLNQLKRAHALGLSGCIGARVAPQPAR